MKNAIFGRPKPYIPNYMSFKTIFIITVSVLFTVVLMNNTEEINFWFFGNTSIPKLAILGVVFFLGLIIGFMAGRPSRKQKTDPFDDYEDGESADDNSFRKPQSNLSDEDREYIR